MKRDRFAKGPSPCEQWQQWALDAVKCRSTGNLMYAIPIDTRTEQHMQVEKLPDPMPPVLQQYPLPRKEKKESLLDCDGSDDDDDDFVDNLTLLAILESQRDAQQSRATNKVIPSVVHVNKTDSVTKDYMKVDPSIRKLSPVPLKGAFRKHANDSPDCPKFFKLVEAVRNLDGPGVHREDRIEL